jgi:hypothetical protein
MLALRIILDGDGSAMDLRERGLELIHLGNDAEPIRVIYLPGGMASGKPSVGFVFELPDGKRYVFAEISAALFIAAARAIATKAKTEGFDL